MVQLKFFSTYVLIIFSLIPLKISSQLFTEESKKDENNKNDAGKDFQCDLVLLPQQQESMFVSVRVKKSEVFVDLYKWPKDKEGLVIVPYRISHSSQFCK